MSQKEMEAMDREVMNTVNGKEGTDGLCAEGLGEAKVDTSFFEKMQEANRRAARRYEIRRRICAVTWILICLAAVAALITALYVPAALPWIVNAGVMCFVVAASIIVDRNIRGWRV